MRTLDEDTRSATQSAVCDAMVATLRAFVSADPAHRQMSLDADDALVTHSGRTWSWRVASSQAMNISADSRLLAGQFEIWVREEPSRKPSWLEALRAMAAPHSSPTGVVLPSDDLRSRTEEIVRRELARQSRGSAG